jgi:predicted Co/Zn/Cd cation transporter (cation efflux family)
LRARLGVAVTVAFALSQGLSAGTAAQFGYAGADGMGLVAIVVIGVPLITLITCAVRWNARPVSTS